MKDSKVWLFLIQGLNLEPSGVEFKFYLSTFSVI